MNGPGGLVVTVLTQIVRDGDLSHTWLQFNRWLKEKDLFLKE